MSNTFDRHTIHRFDEELHALHFQVAEMGELVSNQLCLALEALKKRDLTLAQGIIDREKVVDNMEVAADTVVCGLLARRCPKGGDLRAVIAASKIVNNLERIGDEAVKVANFVIYMQSKDGMDGDCFPLDDIYHLGGVSIGIVQSALEVFERLDVELLPKVSEHLKTLDNEFQNCLHHLMKFIQSGSPNLDNAVSQVLMMKAIVRIGDHASRIAELVAYQIEGEEPQHGAPDLARDFPLSK